MHGVTQGFGAFHDNWMTGDISAFARGGKKGVLPQGPVPELSVRIEAEVLVLLSPVRVGTTQAFDVDAAREVPFDGCLDQLRSKPARASAQCRKILATI